MTSLRRILRAALTVFSLAMASGRAVSPPLPSEPPPSSFAEGRLLVRWQSAEPLPPLLPQALSFAVAAALEKLPPPPEPALLVVRAMPPPPRRFFGFFRSRPLPKASQSGDEIALVPEGDLDALAFRLAHELSHYLVSKSFSARPPLWLDEGLAQLVAAHAAAAAARSAGRTSVRVPPETLDRFAFSLDDLVALDSYPEKAPAAAAFYWQAEALVSRLFEVLGPRAFVDYLRVLSSPDAPGWQTPLREAYYFNDADFQALERKIR